MCGAEEENAPRPDENCNRWHPACRRLRHKQASLTFEFLGKASWCELGNSRDLSDVKRELDPKRRALVDDTLHSDGAAMFLDDTFRDREA